MNLAPPSMGDSFAGDLFNGSKLFIRSRRGSYYAFFRMNGGGAFSGLIADDLRLCSCGKSDAPHRAEDTSKASTYVGGVAL